MNVTDLPPSITKRINVDESGCWLWTAGTAGKGYAYGWWNGAMAYIHRLTYHLMVDDAVPVRGRVDGMTVDHLCGVHRCVNPRHLEYVSHSENCRRFHAANPEHRYKRWANKQAAA